MEDSDSEQDPALPDGSEPGADHAEPAAPAAASDEYSKVGVPSTSASFSVSNSSREAERKPAKEVRSGRNADPSNKPDRYRCFIEILPADLLLQCAEFLGEIQTLCCVREVSRGWLISLDGLEAGYRLWRPLFYRLRAAGTIHAATDTRGQRRRQLKVYDLSCSVPVDAGTPGSSAGTAGGPRTEDEAGNAELKSSSGAERGVPKESPRRSSACLVCGLIQRSGYTGRDCEMCASSLAVVSDGASSTTPRVPYKRVNLSSTVDDAIKTTAVSWDTFSPTTNNIPWKSSTSTPPPGVGGSTEVLRGGRGSRDEEQCEDEGGIDWHFLVKRLTEEKRIAAGWGTLHHGWVWLQGVLQVGVAR